MPPLIRANTRKFPSTVNGRRIRMGRRPDFARARRLAAALSHEAHKNGKAFVDTLKNLGLPFDIDHDALVALLRQAEHVSAR